MGCICGLSEKGNKMYPTFVHRDEIFPTLQVNEADGYKGAQP